MKYCKITDLFLTRATHESTLYWALQVPAEYIKGAHLSKVMLIVSKLKVAIYICFPFAMFYLLDVTYIFISVAYGWRG